MVNKGNYDFYTIIKGNQWLISPQYRLISCFFGGLGWHWRSLVQQLSCLLLLRQKGMCTFIYFYIWIIPVQNLNRIPARFGTCLSDFPKDFSKVCSDHQVNDPQKKRVG